VAAIASQALLGDGSVTNEEETALRVCLRGFDCFDDDPHIAASLKEVNLLVRRNGAEAVLDGAIRAVPTNLQVQLLQTVESIVDADGGNSTDEDELLRRLRKSFVATRKRI
jgi:uncharacterized tellurite resistance protein B-like protein